VDRRFAFADKTTTQTDRRRNQHYHQRYVLHDEAPDSLVFTGHAGSTIGLWLTIVESGRVLVRLAAFTWLLAPQPGKVLIHCAFCALVIRVCVWRSSGAGLVKIKDRGVP
jgi:hypothetical protein